MRVFDLPEERETRLVIKVEIGNSIGWEHVAGAGVAKESKQGYRGFIEIKLGVKRTIQSIRIKVEYSKREEFIDRE